MMKTRIPQPFFLSVPEAAKLCGVSRNTFYTWVRKGKISAYQTPGRTNLIRPSDLEKFMNESGLFVPPSLTEISQRDTMNNQPVHPGPETQHLPAILVVDDDADLRAITARALSKCATIFQAQTGFEALHLLTLRKEIKLVFLDLNMPGQHGTDTLEEINELRPDVKVIILTGHARDFPPHYLQSGRVLKLISKPVSATALRDEVSAVFSESSSGHE